MESSLLPKGFRIIGWILFVPSIIMGILWLINMLSETDVWPFYGVAESVATDAMIIGIALGSLFIVCSRESHEDEMTRAIRLSSLLKAVYVYVGVLVLTTIFINGVDFLVFALTNLVIFPLTYVVVFRYEMHRYKCMVGDEE